MAQILIIDDEPLIREELRQIFEGAGFSVDVAENGREAMKIFVAVEPDLVVTDILIPEMDGIETIRQIRSSARQTKIIAISGGETGFSTQYLSWAQKLGADRVFDKPVDATELLRAVVALLRTKTVMRE